MATQRIAHKLGFAGQVRLTAMGVAAITGLLVFTLVNTPRIRAQSQAPDRQTAAGDRMSFDVASVKVNKTKNLGAQENLSRPGGYVTVTNFTLESLIERTYFPYHPYESPNTRFLLIGTMDWMNSEHFDIEARTEGNPTVEQKQLMLQSLLADRFKLVVHHETRQLPIYALLLANAKKFGPQLIPHADNTNCVRPEALSAPASASAARSLPLCGAFFVHARSGALSPEARNITMESFAANLSGLVGLLVVDHTGLKGTFDLTLLYKPDVGQAGSQLRDDATASDPSAPPSIFTALQEQLGLKLESTKGPVDVLVIDHVEQPSEN